MRRYWVYIMASRSRRLYIGVTRDLARRVREHKTGAVPGFTSRYRITRLVHFDWTSDVRAAIAREKELKRWHRWRKVALVEESNPRWLDLAADWFPELRDQDADVTGSGARAASRVLLRPITEGE